MLLGSLLLYVCAMFGVDAESEVYQIMCLITLTPAGVLTLIICELP